MNERERNTHEAIGLDTIRAVVDDFYSRVQRHPTLAQPFERVHDWPEHKAKLTHFWWVSLGGDPYHDYQFRVGPAHFSLGVPPELVDDWLLLFRQTLDDHLSPELADAWYDRASNMGRSIRMMLSFDPTDPLAGLGRKS